MKPKPLRSERLCRFCLANKKSSIENEHHFIFECPLYENLRTPLFDCLPPMASSLNKGDLFFYIFNAEGLIIHKLAIFCKEAF
jgi:hypothetical protein